MTAYSWGNTAYSWGNTAYSWGNTAYSWGRAFFKLFIVKGLQQEIFPCILLNLLKLN